MPDPVAQFAAAVGTVDRWLDEAPGTAEEDARSLLRLLVLLQQRALDLPPAEGGDRIPERDRAGDAARVARRLANIPIDYYAEVFDPLESVPAEETVVGSLHDDVGDVIGDLLDGLACHTEGDVDAAGWWWRYTYWLHWGDHVNGAVRVLHAWLARTST